MVKRHDEPARRRNPQIERLREIVDRVVQDESRRQSYLAFALELARSMRRAPVPDFEPATKRVVMKWFERGLGGRELWLVGEAIVRMMFGQGR